MISIPMAPNYAKYREAVAAADTLANVPESAGLNAQGIDTVHIQVLPSGGANPTVAVVFWSAALGRFIQEQTPISKAGVGANTGYEFSVAPKGRRTAVIVTTIAGGQCDIYVAGFGLNNLV